MKINTQRAAEAVSFVGNPLLTFSVFVVLVTFRSFDIQKATIISGVAIVGIILPVTIRNYLKSRRGEYTDFDVSDQEQRKNFYPLPVILISLALSVFLLTKQPPEVITGTFLSLLLMVTAGLINLRIKCSLHAAASVFLSFLLLKIWFYTGIVMFLFTVLICASRLVLKRHSIIEIVTGMVVGVIFGGAYYFTM
jgi:membrane-associated phospholipid phosphatase